MEGSKTCENLEGQPLSSTKFCYGSRFPVKRCLESGGYSYPKVIWRTNRIDPAEAMGRLRITKRRFEEAKGLYP